MEQAASEEERHCEFGERETIDWLKRFPATRELLLGLALVQVIALRRLKGFVTRRLLKGENAEHPVLRQFDALLRSLAPLHGGRASIAWVSATGRSSS